MPQYKLTYFNLRGRGEVSRMLFAVAGQQYEDYRLDINKTEMKAADDFQQFKPLTPFGQLPLLEVDGQVICQSNSIGRYLARQFGLAGKTGWDRAKADMVVDTVEDMLTPLVSIFRGNQDDKPRLYKEFTEGHLVNILTSLERLLERNDSGFFVGDGMTWADITFYVWSIFPMFPPSVPSEIDANKFPKCVALRRKVETHPKIAEWIEKRPVTPM